MVAKDLKSLTREETRFQTPVLVQKGEVRHLVIAIIRMMGCPDKPFHFVAIDLTTQRVLVTPRHGYAGFARSSKFNVRLYSFCLHFYLDSYYCYIRGFLLKPYTVPPAYWRRSWPDLACSSTAMRLTKINDLATAEINCRR